MLQSARQPPAGKVLQRLAIVKDDPVKLSFVIDEFGRHTKGLFTNATEEQVTEFIRDVNTHWRAAYSAKKSLTKEAAASALKSHQKDLLRTLGKEKPEQADYQRLAKAMESTFDDETDNLYSIATRREKVEGLPPGSVWWLDQVHGENLITPEDKSSDNRLVTCTMDNIVKTNADTADTATALYEIDQASSSVDDVAKDKRKWELHAHVRQNGDVDFAHTKVNDEHKTTVNDWFAANIDADERAWGDD